MMMMMMEMTTIGQREAGTQFAPGGQALKALVDFVKGHERPDVACDDVKHGGGGECQGEGGVDGWA